MSDASPPPLPKTEPPTDSGPTRPSTLGWGIFGLVLIAPAVLTLLTANSNDLWPIFTFPASAVAGIYCGLWLAMRICRTTPGKILGSFALAAVCGIVSFALCCAGCAIGGAQLNFH